MTQTEINRYKDEARKNTTFPGYKLLVPFHNILQMLQLFQLATWHTYYNILQRFVTETTENQNQKLHPDPEVPDDQKGVPVLPTKIWVLYLGGLR